MSNNTEVMFSDTAKGTAACVAEIFEHFGGAEAMLKSSRDVYLKVNAVDSRQYCYTDPEVIAETIKYLKAHGARDVYVIENCTQGNITRLVFAFIGIFKICRQTGAIPVCLDETDASPIFLEELQSFVDISSFVHERLIKDRDKNLYISLPKLKTHSMSQVTLSIKNQFGLVHQHSRIADHNYRLHQKFADIFNVIRPDFVIVDGLIATDHGHYIAESNADECIVPMNCLIAGPDPLAVDVVGAAFMGFSVDEVEHLRLAALTGFGQSDISAISIINEDIFKSRKKNLTCQLLDKFPPELKILRGKERCCMEGCRRNTESLVELLYCDFKGKGDFTILMGKGIDKGELDKIKSGPVHIAGGCAISENGVEMVRRFGKKNVTFSNGCNDLAQNVAGICRHMKVTPLKLSPASFFTSLTSLIMARAKGSKANIPPLF